MLDPYRLIVVNITLCFILLVGILIYRFVYPKKKINLFILLIIISLLPLFSMLRSGTYQSGDLSLHAIRTMSFYNILFSEHIIPRWTPEFYAGFGDPYFYFSYFLPYLLGSVIHFIGFSVLASLKIMMAISFVLSGVFMYMFVKNELGEKAGFTAGIFYLFTPFHLVNMHFQVTIAQTLSYLFLPLCLYLTKKIILTPKPKWLIFLAITEMLLILSHQVISLIFLPIMVLYAIYLSQENKKNIISNLWKFFVSIITGLLLSSFYWLPILFESQFTQQALNTQVILFPSIQSLLCSPWRYGLLFQGPKGELSYIIGYTQIFIIVFSLYLYFKNKFDKKTKLLFLFFISITAILIFLILPISKSLWYTIPFFKSFQFSTRLLVPLSLCIAVLAGIVVKIIDKKWFFILLCSITILYTILNWGNRTTIPTINDRSLQTENRIWFGLEKAGLEPSSPIWINLNKKISSEKRTHDINVVSGDATIKQISRTSTYHTYIADVKSNYAKIKENTFYFPGWLLKIDNLQRPIEYKAKDSYGLITFRLNKGSHKIEIIFKDSSVIKISSLISIFTVLLIFLYLIKSNLFFFRIFQYFQHPK